ncbi:MAG: hypothetical protein HY863_04585 [Chloroflexi bacterium]|nr:hypothetical protein [Chloroflexota bacterium]
MNITLKINGMDHSIDTAPRAATTLFAALHGLGFHEVKFIGEEMKIVKCK